MKKVILTALAGAALTASSLAMPNIASAQSLVATNVISNGAVVSGFSAEQTVQRDFWSDLVDDILDRPHDPPPPPPPPHRGPHHPPPPPPPPPHRGPHHPPPPPHHHKPAPPPPHKPGPHYNPPPPHHKPAPPPPHRPGPHHNPPPPHHGPHR